MREFVEGRYWRVDPVGEVGIVGDRWMSRTRDEMGNRIVLRPLMLTLKVLLVGRMSLGRASGAWLVPGFDDIGTKK